MSTIARLGRGAFLLLISYVIVSVVADAFLGVISQIAPMVLPIPDQMVLNAAYTVPAFFLAAYAADQELSLKKMGLFVLVYIIIGFPLAIIVPFPLSQFIAQPGGLLVAVLVVYFPGLSIFKDGGDPETA